MSFNKLPAELLILIGEKLKKNRDLNSLAQVNRHSFQSLNEHLYRYRAANRDRALHWGIKERILATVTMAIHVGANLNVKRGKSTPVIAAAKNTDPDILQVLLENGADPNVHCGGGFNALYFAMKSHDFPSVLLLLENGANPNIQDCQLNTLLHLHLQQGVPLKILHLLLKFGADPSAQNGQLETPLHIAVKRKHFEFFKLLLRFEPNLSAIDMFQRTPFAEALLRQDEGFEMARLLLEHGASPSIAGQPHQPIHDMAQLGDVRGLKLLLKYKADINASNGDNETALSLAIKRGHTMAACELLQAGAKVEFEYDSPALHLVPTPLQWAATKGDAMMCQLLLKHDPNPDTRLLFSSLPVTEYDSPRATEILAYKGLSAQKMKKLMTQLACAH
ncbi:ankyrin repeat-containing domain protein [Penicillium angulare]|uniref:ankyrin repeat-containing domain protein n=1 Tax=Penicillium angulare TaxID=116970 RepID=UPI00253FCE81|nr:ankyrin repeat-containing domain protein [Penicillium angulare]KAJ5287549.1 ankyrin repeat-containing domain protein [Penicillium angulare]